MSGDGVAAGSVTVIVAILAGEAQPLVSALESRGRTVVVTSEPDEWVDRLDEIRALAVATEATPLLRGRWKDLIEGCHEAGLPVIGLGSSASLVQSVISPATVPESTETSADGAGTAHRNEPFVLAPPPRVLEVDVTDAGMEDRLVAPTPSGVQWLGCLGRSGLEDRDGWTVLAVTGTVPVLAVAGMTYVVGMDVLVDDSRLDGLIADNVISEASRPFFKAHGAALLGRWVDLVVGRTEEEMPWGRRGPQPVASPGLSLNPA